MEGHEEDVVGIVDHHVDSKINYPNIQEKLVSSFRPFVLLPTFTAFVLYELTFQIEVVGSCSTLVAYTIMRNKPHLLDDQHLATALVSVYPPPPCLRLPLFPCRIQPRLITLKSQSCWTHTTSILLSKSCKKKILK